MKSSSQHTQKRITTTANHTLPSTLLFLLSTEEICFLIIIIVIFLIVLRVLRSILITIVAFLCFALLVSLFSTQLKKPTTEPIPPPPQLPSPRQKAQSDTATIKVPLEADETNDLPPSGRIKSRPSDVNRYIQPLSISNS